MSRPGLRRVVGQRNAFNRVSEPSPRSIDCALALLAAFGVAGLAVMLGAEISQEVGR